MNITITDHETLINETAKLKTANQKTQAKRSSNCIYSKNGKENTQHIIQRERERERERERAKSRHLLARKSREKLLDQSGLFKLDLQFFNDEENEEHQTLGLPKEDSAEEIKKTEEKEELIKTIEELGKQLEETEKDRDLAAEIGQALLEKNNGYAATIQKLNDQIKNWEEFTKNGKAPDWQLGLYETIREQDKTIKKQDAIIDELSDKLLKTNREKNKLIDINNSAFAEIKFLDKQKTSQWKGDIILKEYDEDIEKLSIKLEEITEEKRELEKQLREKKQDLELTSKTNSAILKEKATLEIELAEAKRKLAEKTKEVRENSFLPKKTNQTNQNEEDQAEEEKWVEKIEQENSKLESEAEKQKAELRDVKARLNEMAGLLLEKEEKIQDLAKQNESILKQNLLLEEKTNSLDNQFSNLPSFYTHDLYQNPGSRPTSFYGNVPTSVTPTEETKKFTSLGDELAGVDSHWKKVKENNNLENSLLREVLKQQFNKLHNLQNQENSLTKWIKELKNLWENLEKQQSSEVAKRPTTYEEWLRQLAAQQNETFCQKGRIKSLLEKIETANQDLGTEITSAKDNFITNLDAKDLGEELAENWEEVEENLNNAQGVEIIAKAEEELVQKLAEIEKTLGIALFVASAQKASEAKEKAEGEENEIEKEVDIDGEWEESWGPRPDWMNLKDPSFVEKRNKTLEEVKGKSQEVVEELNQIKQNEREESSKSEAIEKEIRELIKNCEEKEKEISNNTRLAEIEENIQRDSSSLSSLQNENKEKLRARQNSLTETNKTITTQQRDLANAEKRVEEFQKQLDKEIEEGKIKKGSKREKQISNGISVIESQISQKREDLKNNLQKKEELTDKIKKLEAKQDLLDQHENSINDLKDKFEATQNENRALKDELNNLKKGGETAAAEVEDLKNKEKNLRESLDSVNESSNELENELNNLEGWTKDNPPSAEEVKRLQGIFSLLQKKLQEYKNKKDELEARLKEIVERQLLPKQIQAEDLDRKIADLQQEITNIEETRKVLEKEIKSAKDEKEEELKKQIEDLTRNLEEVRAELAEAVKERESLKNKTRSETQKIEEKNSAKSQVPSIENSAAAPGNPKENRHKNCKLYQAQIEELKKQKTTERYIYTTKTQLKELTKKEENWLKRTGEIYSDFSLFYKFDIKDDEKLQALTEIYEKYFTENAKSEDLFSKWKQEIGNESFRIELLQKIKINPVALVKTIQRLGELIKKNKDLANQNNTLEALVGEKILSTEETTAQTKKSDLNWKNIDLNFVTSLVEEWTSRKFTYEQVREWINIGLKVNDARYAAWLRDVKKVDSDWVLNHGNDEELREEYAKYSGKKAKKEISTQTDQKDLEDFQKRAEENKQTALQSFRRRRKEKNEIEDKLNKTETALLKSYEELADVTNNLTNSQIALQEEKTQKEDLELKVSELEEDKDYLNEQLTKESERASELSDEAKNLQEKLNQAKEIIRELASWRKEREELLQNISNTAGELSKELGKKFRNWNDYAREKIKQGINNSYQLLSQNKGKIATGLTVATLAYYNWDNLTVEQIQEIANYAGSLTNQTAAIGSGFLSQIAAYYSLIQQKNYLEKPALNESNFLPEENNQFYEQIIADLRQNIIWQEGNYTELAKNYTELESDLKRLKDNPSTITKTATTTKTIEIEPIATPDPEKDKKITENSQLLNKYGTKIMGLIDERAQSRTRAQYAQANKDQLVEGFQKQIKELEDSLEAEKSKEVPTSTIKHTKTTSQLPVVLPRKTKTKTETATITQQITEPTEALQQERDILFTDNQLLNDAYDNLNTQLIKTKLEKTNLQNKLNERANITQIEYEELIAEKSQLVTVLDSWTSQFTNQTASEVKRDLDLALANQEKHTEQDLKPSDYNAIKEELRGWTETFGNKKPTNITNQIDNLKKRPDIPITEKEWNEDWSQRIKKTDLDKINNSKIEVENERDQRPNITRTDYENLITERTELSNNLTEWTNHFPNQTAEEIRRVIDKLDEKLKLWENEFPDQNSFQVKKNLTDLIEWTETFDGETPQQVWLRLNQPETELTQRPKTTHEDYQKLQTNQKPDNLPNDWQERIRKIPSLEENITALNQQINLAREELGLPIIGDNLHPKNLLTRENFIDFHKNFHARSRLGEIAKKIGLAKKEYGADRNADDIYHSIEKELKRLKRNSQELSNFKNGLDDFGKKQLTAAEGRYFHDKHIGIKQLLNIIEPQALIPDNWQEQLTKFYSDLENKIKNVEDILKDYLGDEIINLDNLATRLPHYRQYWINPKNITDVDHNTLKKIGYVKADDYRGWINPNNKKSRQGVGLKNETEVNIILDEIAQQLGLDDHNNLTADNLQGLKDSQKELKRIEKIIGRKKTKNQLKEMADSPLQVKKYQEKLFNFFGINDNKSNDPWEKYLTKKTDYDELDSIINGAKNYLSETIPLPDLKNETLKKFKEAVNDLKAWTDQFEDQKATEVAEKIADLIKERNEYQLRPNITQQTYDELVKERDNGRRVLGVDNLNKLSQILKNETLQTLLDRPTKEQLDQEVRNAQQQEADKYKNHIDPNDNVKLEEEAKKAGFGFKQQDIDNAVQKEKEKWKDFIDPKDLESKAKETGWKYRQEDLDEAVTTGKSKYEGWVDPKTYRTDWIDPTKLKEWTDAFGDKKPVDIANQIANLKKRPDIPITKEQWENDYKDRPTITDSNNVNKQLKNYRDNLVALEITDLDSWFQQVQKWKNSDLKLKDLQNKLEEKEIAIIDFKKKLEKEKDKLTTLRRQKRLDEKTLNRQIASLQRKSESEKNKLNEKLENLQNSKLVSEEQLNKKIGQLTEEIKNLNDAYKKEKENYDKKLTQLQTDLEQEQKSNQQSQTKLNNWQIQIENIAAKLATAGIGYLAGRSRSKRPVDYQGLEKDIEKLISVKKQLETKLKSEQASHTITKTERDNKEKEIIQKLNTVLSLNLTNPTLKQVITKIKELINKPSTIIVDNEKVDSLEKNLARARQTIQCLRAQLQDEKSTVLLGEGLANIINLEKETMSKILSKQLFITYSQQLDKVINYEQLARCRHSIIKQHLIQNDNQETIQPKNELIQQPKIERIILISLLAMSLLTIFGLSIKLKKRVSKPKKRNF